MWKEQEETWIMLRSCNFSLDIKKETEENLRWISSILITKYKERAKGTKPNLKVDDFKHYQVPNKCWLDLLHGILKRVLASSSGFQSGNSHPSNIFHHHPQTETQPKKKGKKCVKQRKAFSLYLNFHNLYLNFHNWLKSLPWFWQCMSLLQTYPTA